MLLMGHESVVVAFKQVGCYVDVVMIDNVPVGVLSADYLNEVKEKLMESLK